MYRPMLMYICISVFSSFFIFKDFIDNPGNNNYLFLRLIIVKFKNKFIFLF